MNTAENDHPPARLPRETTVLFGHAEAERELLDSYKTGRTAHAWLIGGPRGVGKATLAYRFARFIFAHPDSASPQVRNASSLAVDAEHPVARRMAAQTQGDLLVLERTINEQTGKLYTVIRVEDVRRTTSFFGSTPGEDGWRIVIVDSVDELQREGANALLKALEEPPERSLLLLISHSPGRELATIRSRCRRLLLRPLEVQDAARAVVEATGCDPDDQDLSQALEAAEGSPGRAVALLDDGQMLKLRRRVTELLAQLPDPDMRALHALADGMGSSDPKVLDAFLDQVSGWLSSRLRERLQQPHHMARLAATWEAVNRATRDAEDFNLERKPLVFTVFGALSEAARG